MLVEVGVFKGVGHFKCKFQVERGVIPQLLLASENYIDYPLMWCQNIGGMFFSFRHKAGM